ncbi:MAG: CHAT domain-containing protein [Anaerolineae bacterium]|nr:CHAT domain-containing protein [Anaerolineae bacterium]
MASYDVSDFKIDMTPDGDRVRLRLTDRANPAGRDFAPRPLPQIAAEVLDRLRQDEATAEEVAVIQQALAEWLLGGGVDAFLQAALAALTENNRLRLVLNIHPQLWSALSELPFELLPWGNDPLLLHPKVASLVYQLPETGAAAPLDAPTPLRILLVRASPDDLGPVPKGAPLRDRWTALGQGGNGGGPRVQVDLVSRDEPGTLGAATWTTVRQRLKETRYHLLVYLGHGQVDLSTSSAAGALMLEAQPDTQGRVYSSPVRAATLATWLHNYPTPVVVLASCLTAFEGVDERRQAVFTRLAPAWARGNQGVAQALVNSPSGVRVGIGMRYNLNIEAAETLLGTLVESLLQTEGGDIEAAVRAARLEMQASDDTSPAWSAPVVFTAPGPPLVLPGLAAPPATRQAATPSTTTPSGPTITHFQVEDLYLRLLKYTDSEDLYDLAFRLGLDADEFETATKPRFARGLLDRLERQGRLAEFVQLLQREKPWVLR